MSVRLSPRVHRSRSPVAVSKGCRRCYPPTTPTNGSRGFTGQGPFDVLGDPKIPGPASLHDNRLSWRLRPNPLGSNTSCRCRSRRPRWEHRDRSRRTALAGRLVRARLRASSDESVGARPREANACARAVTGEGRLPHLLAKGDAFRCTRGAFHHRTSLAGSVLLHRLSPTCGWRTRASSISGPHRARTVRRGVTGTRSPQERIAFAIPLFLEGSTRRAR